jgi:hypothetical protein
MGIRTAASNTFIIAAVVQATDFLGKHVQVGLDTSESGHIKLVLDIRLRDAAPATA